MKISYNDEDHSYTLDGEPALSVTQIMQIAKLTDYSGVPEDILARAQAFGNAVHKATEYYDKGELDEDELDPALKGHLHQWKEFVRSRGIKFTDIEQPVAHPEHLYCGTPDRIGLMGRDVVVVDIKTGKWTGKAEKTTGVQLAAYSWAYGYDRPIAGRPDKLIGVWLSTDGCRIKEYTGSEYGDMWAGCLTIVNDMSKLQEWLKQKKKKTT